MPSYSPLAFYPSLALVIQCGTPTSMPFAHAVPAIFQAWYDGNETGDAVADALFGVSNSSGSCHYLGR